MLSLALADTKYQKTKERKKEKKHSSKKNVAREANGQ